MSYYYNFIEEDLRIPLEQLDRANRLIEEYHATCLKRGWVPQINPDSSDPALKQVIESNGWHVRFDEEEGIIHISSPWDEKNGTDGADWLPWLAPIMADGCFAEIENEDGERYRYVFSRGKCYRISPRWQVGPEDQPLPL